MKLIKAILTINKFKFKISKEAQTLEQFYEYQDNSKHLKDMIKTIEDEINNHKKVNYR